MKIKVNYISVLLICAMLITSIIPSMEVHASTDEYDCHIITLENNACLKTKETDSGRVVEYYENGIKLQTAVYDNRTQEILYYDMSSGTDAIAPIRYSLDDFISVPQTEVEYNLGSTYSVNSSFSFLKSKQLQLSGTTYYHNLYGYTDTKQYEERSWHFAAGIAVSVICAALSIIFPEAAAMAIITGAVSVVGGTILSYLSVTTWVKDSFWVYKFKRVSPDPIEFVCPSYDSFIYKRERKIEVNGDVGYWEVYEEKNSFEIDCVRDDILTNPGLYF